ncbi:MAG: TIGR03936 family radical SAM-associated protein [Negativicutes bacterium]|nr:TIGR03936 family radical SAM-associated protein [Negativicutes bacterium]
MRIFLKFQKNAEVRWISHLDLIKVWERAVRRTQLPIAFSQGFNPRPKLSLATALAVGVSSEAEYIEMEFSEELPLKEILQRLSAQMPSGLPISGIGVLPEKSPALMSLVFASLYRITLPPGDSREIAALEHALLALLAEKQLIFNYQNREGKTICQDLRPGLFTAEWDEKNAVLLLKVETSSRLFVRPQHFLSVLAQKMQRPDWPAEQVGLHRLQLTMKNNLI